MEGCLSDDEKKVVGVLYYPSFSVLVCVARAQRSVVTNIVLRGPLGGKPRAFQSVQQIESRCYDAVAAAD